MTPRDDPRRAVTAVFVTALLVVGAGAVTSGAIVSDGTARVQETTATTAGTTTAQATGVSVENLTAPERVRIGTNYTVSANIVNRGDESFAGEVSYRIAGNVIGAELVEVAENATQTIQFNVTTDDTTGFPAGTFTHGVFAEDTAVTANVTLTEANATTEATETTTPGTTTAGTTTAETPTETTATTEATTVATETTAATTTTTATTTAAPATETTTAAPATETTTAAPATTTTTATETTTAVTEPATTTVAEAPTASLTFERQDSTGEAVTVQSVTVPEGGFVVVHDESIIEGNVVGSILGQSGYLAPGLSENVTVELNQSLNQSQRLVAVVYRDSNDNQQFDFVASNRTADGPYTKVDSREAVNGIAVIEVTDETTNETAETTTETVT
ncbi:DUF7282 domain-containing protein [Halorussus ruber]|uniref:DUF7282 domain-containing protein n=1 Tax=Halorussus ruber TaxID=1126238 RepID=UPI001091EF03|nr:hypothetical protein [Halorussus ruber]